MEQRKVDHLPAVGHANLVFEVDHAGILADRNGEGVRGFVGFEHKALLTVEQTGRPAARGTRRHYFIGARYGAVGIPGPVAGRGFHSEGPFAADDLFIVIARYGDQAGKDQ